VKLRHISYWIALVAACLLLTWSELAADEESKTVLGPRNIDLADGAAALMAGNGEEGVRLTLRGLEMAQGDYERKISHSNLCAGYVLLDQPQTALRHCNWVIERDPRHWRTYNNRALAYLRLERFAESEADIARGQALNPASRNLKESKGLLLDKTHPVVPNVEIDERRSAMDDGNEDPSEN
jgi:tetratricopeptide (TPR) repeat protein